MQNRWHFYHQTEPVINENWTLNTLHHASPLMGSNGIFIGTWHFKGFNLEVTQVFYFLNKRISAGIDDVLMPT